MGESGSALWDPESPSGAPNAADVYGPLYTKPIPPNVLSITVNKSDTFRVSHHIRRL